MTSPSALATKALIGNDSAWLLAFHEIDGGQISSAPTLEIGRDDYYAEVRASLPGGLEGGGYEFTIEGLTDAHYAQIKQTATTKLRIVRLYLFWRDTNSSVGGYLANLAGLTDVVSAVRAADIPEALVADLRIVSVSRKAGERRYETKITARERVFHDVESARVRQAVPSQPLQQALQTLLSTACGYQPSRDFTLHDIPSGLNREFAARGTVREALAGVAGRLEEATGKHGRGMLLIRDGKLQIGPRPIPLSGAGQPPQKLTVGGGLIETEALEPIVSDPNFDTSTGQQSPSRRQFKLTLKGRPDLKPGDLVEFDSPPEDVDTTTGGLFGSLGDLAAGSILPTLGDEQFQNPVRLYVSAVDHRMGRTSGFSTVLTGVEITGTSPADCWDTWSVSSGPEAPAAAPASTPALEAATAVRRLAESVTGSRAMTDAGEIRQMNHQASGEIPSQTVTVWRGLAAGDGNPNQARRLAVQRPSPAPATGVPYVTPFAWGKTGLVLPRYPGTRVLVAHRDGRADDALDLGAFWESGRGPDSQPGDYWLILPSGVAAAQRSSLGDSETPQEHTGKVTQDLIDADGNRVIEAGEFTLRVGRNTLHNAGERPARAGDADSITIEHTGGATIVMKSDGSVKIKGKTVTIESDGAIKLKGTSVEVE